MTIVSNVIYHICRNNVMCYSLNGRAGLCCPTKTRWFWLGNIDRLFQALQALVEVYKYPQSCSIVVYKICKYVIIHGITLSSWSEDHGFEPHQGIMLVRWSGWKMWKVQWWIRLFMALAPKKPNWVSPILAVWPCLALKSVKMYTVKL